MKQRVIRRLIGFLIVLVGLIAMNYPLLAGWINDRFAYREFQGYRDQIAQTGDAEIQRLLETARAYNSALANGEDLSPFKDFSLLQTDASLGFLEVPQIGVNLAVHYSTENEVISKNLGLVEDASLPVGGESTHAVISGHTGMAARRMLTDLTQMELGDVFFMHTLSLDLAYQVDQIVVVEPWDASELEIVSGEDYLTLLTCTPYGVNDHRLLVRGTRIDYDFSAPNLDTASVRQRLSNVEKIRLAVAAFSLLILIFVIIYLLRATARDAREARKKKQSS